MPTETSQLKAAYPLIIERLDELYSKGLYHSLTDAELSEADELRQRAWMIYTELSQRSRFSAPLFA